MAEQVQKTRTSTKTEAKVENIPATKDASKLKQELDDLLDEIDGVLEENAQEFVSSYIQKGGQ